MNELTVKNLVKKYGKKTALSDVSFSLENGVYGLLGPNGAGKTTLINIIAGILKESSGCVLWNRTEIGLLGSRYREILGYAPQNAALYPEFRADEFLRYMAAVKGLSLNRKKLDEKIGEILAIVNLKEDAGRKLKTYSGGMKQRINIAQALLGDPHLLLLDEPTAGLDPRERIHLKNVISQASSERIVLWSTHIVSDVENLAKEILLLKKGELAGKKTVKELKSDLEGRVFRLTVNTSDVERLQDEYPVSNIRVDGQKVYVRLISENPPAGAEAVSPLLEDVYLFYFDELTEGGHEAPGL